MEVFFYLGKKGATYARALAPSPKAIISHIKSFVNHNFYKVFSHVLLLLLIYIYFL